MANWYYYDNDGRKQGLVTGGQLKRLAKAGQITPDTIVETEEGRTAPARKVKGLTFGESVQANTPPSNEQSWEKFLSITADDLRKDKTVVSAAGQHTPTQPQKQTAGTATPIQERIPTISKRFISAPAVAGLVASFGCAIVGGWFLVFSLITPADEFASREQKNQQLLAWAEKELEKAYDKWTELEVNNPVHLPAEESTEAFRTRVATQNEELKNVTDPLKRREILRRHTDENYDRDLQHTQALRAWSDHQEELSDVRASIARYQRQIMSAEQELQSIKAGREWKAKTLTWDSLLTPGQDYIYARRAFLLPLSIVLIVLALVWRPLYIGYVTACPHCRKYYATDWKSLWAGNHPLCHCKHCGFQWHYRYIDQPFIEK